MSLWWIDGDNCFAYDIVFHVLNTWNGGVMIQNALRLGCHKLHSDIAIGSESLFPEWECQCLSN